MLYFVEPKFPYLFDRYSAEPTVQTRISLEEQSDQGLHCLQFYQYFCQYLGSLSYNRTSIVKF